MDSSFGTNNILGSLFIIKANVSEAQINRFPRVLRVHFLLVPKTVTLPEHLFQQNDGARCCVTRVSVERGTNVRDCITFP